MIGKYIVGGIFIVIGLSALTGIDLGRFIFPVVLILIGLVIISGRNGKRYFQMNESEATQDSLNEVLIFSGAQRKVTSDTFTAGKIVAIFGAAEFDLSEVKTKEKVLELEAVAVFGGIQLRIPNNWYVMSEAAGIIGGIDNRAKAQKKEIELHLKGSAIFGGIEISN